MAVRWTRDGAGPLAGPWRLSVIGCRRSTPSTKPITPAQNDSAIKAKAGTNRARKAASRMVGTPAPSAIHIRTPPSRATAATRRDSRTRRHRARPAC